MLPVRVVLQQLMALSRHNMARRAMTGAARHLTASTAIATHQEPQSQTDSDMHSGYPETGVDRTYRSVIIGGGAVGMPHLFAQAVAASAYPARTAKPVIIPRGNIKALREKVVIRHSPGEDLVVNADKYTVHESVAGLQADINKQIESNQKESKEAYKQVIKLGDYDKLRELVLKTERFDPRFDLATVAVQNDDFDPALESVLKAGILKPKAKILICLNGVAVRSEMLRLLDKYDPKQQHEIIVTVNDAATAKREPGNVAELLFNGTVRIAGYHRHTRRYYINDTMHFIVDYLNLAGIGVDAELYERLEVAIYTKAAINAALTESIASNTPIHRIMHSFETRVLFTEINRLLGRMGFSLDKEHIDGFAGKAKVRHRETAVDAFPSIYRNWSEGKRIELGDIWGPIFELFSPAVMSEADLKHFKGMCGTIHSLFARLLPKLTPEQLANELQKSQHRYPAYHSFIQSLVHEYKLPLEVKPGSGLYSTIGIMGERSAASAVKASEQDRALEPLS